MTFSADYVSRIKRTKWLRMMRLNFLCRHENIDPNLVTFCVSVSRLLWYLSNWPAFLGAQTTDLKPYVLYSNLVSTPSLQTVQCQFKVNFALFHLCKIIYFCSVIRYCAKCTDTLWGPHSQLPIQCVSCRGFSPSVKRPVLEANSSPASNAEPRNDRSYTAAPRICLIACTCTSSTLTFLYRKGGLLDPEEEGIISLRSVGENLPINMT